MRTGTSGTGSRLVNSRPSVRVRHAAPGQSHNGAIQRGRWTAIPTAKSSQRTLSQHVGIRLGANLIVAIALICTVLWGAMDQPYEPVPPAPSYTEQLLAQHDCWKGEQPADVDAPHGVLIRRDGDVVARYSAKPAVVQAALDDVFGTDDPALSVIAFCR